MNAPIPVTILTGFLGAGKTTLLNRLLTEFHGRRVAVVVNEFGDVGIDDRLLPGGTDTTVTLSNGAICCAALGDTANALAQLLDLRAEGDLERVFIETTGLADPFPLIKAFLNRPSLAKAYALDGIVTVADAFHMEDQLVSMPEARQQFEAADLVILNKTDLVAPADVEQAEGRIREINPAARVVRTERAAVPLDVLFAPVEGPRAYEQAEGFRANRHSHNPGVMSVALAEERPLALDRVAHWIGAELVLNADKLMRYKGILYIAGREERFVFQGVHHQFETVPDRPWRPGEPRRSDVVLIGRDLDRAAFEASFRACAAEG